MNGIKPYKHQQKILDDDPKWTGLFLGTGSGKSLVALSLAQGATLVICPKILKEDKTWEKQLEKMGKSLPLTVISKETFRRDHLKLPSFDTIICDEVHTLCGVTPATRYRKKVEIPHASQLFEALDGFILRNRPKRFYALSATPAKSAMSVWGLGTLLGKKWDFKSFREAFYIKIPIPHRQVWVQKKDEASKERLAKIVQGLGYTGRLSDFFDVPEQTHITKYVELTEKQKKRIKELPQEFPDPIVLIGKKHCVENGLLNGDQFNESEFFPTEKEDLILGYAEEFPRMIIFAKYTKQIERLTEVLKDYPVFTLTGATKDRENLMSTLQKTDKYILVCQSSISAGWELPLCEVVVYASLSYSLVDKVQSMGRVLRANHLKKNLYITLVVRGGIDEEVYKCIENKVDFNERIFYERK